MSNVIKVLAAEGRAVYTRPVKGRRISSVTSISVVKNAWINQRLACGDLIECTPPAKKPPVTKDKTK